VQIGLEFTNPPILELAEHATIFDPSFVIPTSGGN